MVRERSIERLVMLYQRKSFRNERSLDIGQDNILSIEPFIARESTSLVLRNESMSFPRDDSSSSCRARSTGLNYLG